MTLRRTTRPATNPPTQLAGLPVAPDAKPFIGHTWSLLRRPFAFLDALGSLGDIVRMNIGKTSVYMLTRPELVHSILVTEARKVQRGGVFFDRVRNDLVTQKGLGTAEGRFHLQRRRLMQPALHRNNVGVYVDLMRTNTRELSASWADGQVVELDRAVYGVITENTADSMFGIGLSAEMSSTVRWAMPVLTDNFMVRMQTPKALERFPLPASRRFDHALRELGKVTNKVIERRLADLDADGDLLGMLLTTTDPDTGEPLAVEQVYDEIISALFAGIVTTATTLSWVFYELDRWPDVQDRVLEEIRTVLDKDLPLDEAINQLDYTRRAVTEVLRLHPILMFVRRVVEPIELGGVTLPVGTQLGYSPYTLHRDARLYPEPMRLDPDRWLTDGANSATSLPPGAFMPFGQGRHRCIGEFFAWAEILVALVELLPRWKLDLVPDQEVRALNGVLPRPSSLRMTVTAR
nr:cytochrome P450 [uncultured bacterium]